LDAEARNDPQAGQDTPSEPRKTTWLARWWPVLVWAVIISYFSTDTFTSDKTESIFIPILHWLLPKASYPTLLTIHYYIRKSAHFVEYFVFSLLVLRAIRGGRHKTRLAWALAAIGIVAGYAALDEFHQSFVPGRTAAVSDVLLDTTGGTAAQAIAGLVLLWGHVRERQKKA
jgi:VanZ family protein